MKLFFALLAMLTCIQACEAAPRGQSDVPQLNDGFLAYALGDNSKAVQLLEPLARKNEPLAELILGRIHLDKFSLAYDCASGVAWIARAAGHGNAEAAFDLATLYRRGECVAKSDANALRWFEKAASEGHRAAPGAIAETYLEAEAPDYAAALPWLERAAKMFDGEAAYRLGTLYARGQGVDRDEQEAFKWFEVARLMSAHYGNEPEPELLARDRIRERLTPLQVAAASAEAERTLAAVIEGIRDRARWQTVEAGAPTVAKSDRESAGPP